MHKISSYKNQELKKTRKILRILVFIVEIIVGVIIAWVIRSEGIKNMQRPHEEPFMYESKNNIINSQSDDILLSESSNTIPTSHVLVNSDEVSSMQNYKIVNALRMVQWEVDKALEREQAAETVHYDRYIFVGDSRFVAMSAFGDRYEDVFVCEVGVSYDFLEENYREIRDLETDKSAIVIGLGINDLKQAEYYINFINENYFKSDIFFLTVNPIEPGKSYNTKDSDIRKFNNEMKANEGKYTIINTYNALIDHGYSTQDGIHYDSETTQYLYSIIKDYFGSFA